MIITEKTDAAIYVDGELLCGVMKVEISEASKNKYLYEMLSDEPWFTVKANKKYSISIKLYGECRSFDGCSGIVVIADNQRFDFGNTKVESVVYTVAPDGKPVTEVKLSCTEGSATNV